MHADHLQKKRVQIQKIEKAGDSRYIHQNELDKVCFQHNMTYGDYKDLVQELLRIKCYVSKGFTR